MFAEIRSTVVLNALELTLSTSASSARSKWENAKMQVYSVVWHSFASKELCPPQQSRYYNDFYVYRP